MLYQIMRVDNPRQEYPVLPWFRIIFIKTITMKKFTLILTTLVLAVFFTTRARAQNPIPNPDFETWTTDTMGTMSSYFLYDHPTGWFPFLSSIQWSFSSGTGPLSCYKSTASYTGTYALNLTVDNDSVGADMATLFASAKRPLTLNGYYKFTGVAGDTANIVVGITKGDPISWLFGDSTLEVGQATKAFAGASVTSYQPFSMPITYKDLTTFPDSAIILITSTDNFGSSVPGQKLWVDNLYFSGYSGVNDQDEQKNVFVFPNPTSDLLYIDLRANARGNDEVELLDLSGRTVLQVKQSNRFDHIDLSGLETGTYILHVKTEDGLLTKKIVKN